MKELGPILAANERRLFAVCFHMLGNRADAEDALQDTLCAALEGFARFRGEAQVSTWLYRIAIRMALRIRARRRSDSGDGAARELAAPEPVDGIEQRELQARATLELAAMPAEQRAVVSLSLIEGLSHAQIAEVLGCAEGTVGSRLHRARAELARRMAKYV